MKTRILTFIMLFIAASAFADVIPEFHFPTPVMGSDGSNATCVALVYVDGTMVESENVIEVAFFDQNGTCRGRNFVINWGSPYGYQFQSVFYGNTGQLLTFKFYNHNTGESSDDLGYVCTTSLNYTPHLIFGTLTNPENIYFYIPTTCTFTNVNGSNWSTAANWTPRIPVSCDNAVISTNQVCVVSDASSISFSTLTIKDGAQFFAPVGSSITAAVEKEIVGYSGERDNYYFISSPLTATLNYNNFAATGMLNGNYDLYSFLQDPDDNLEWQNFRIDEELEADYAGYLYANEQNTTLSFNGTLFLDNATDIYTKLTFDEDYDFPGFNLVGNPYPSNAEVSSSTPGKISGYFTLNESRDEVIPCIGNPIIAPCSALFAVANSTKAKVSFTPTSDAATARRPKGNGIEIELFHDGTLIDRSCLRFNGGNNLQKFTMNEDATHIFFREDGKDYAIVQGNERMNQLPLYFETKEYGQYTINVKMENMNCEYLHLIDNITGADIDLNATPSYTFRAKQGDYSARFRLVFEGTGVEEEGNTESFVIVEGNRLIIPEVQNGSTLTIIDMMGRVVSSQTISGSFDQVMNLANGMYIVRLNSKTQKIVVK